MNRGWSQAAGGDGEGPGREILKWILEGDAERVEGDAGPGLVDEIAALADPACALRGASPPEDGRAYILRPARIGGEPAVLLACYQQKGAGVRVEAQLFSPHYVRDEGRRFFENAPARFHPLEVKPASDDDVEAARAALAALLSPEPDGRPRRLRAPDAAAFWRRVAALVGLLPSGLAPLVSAAWGVEDGAVAAFVADAEQGEPPAVSQRAQAALEALSRAEPDFAPSARWPEDPQDAPAHFVACLHAAIEAAGAAPETVRAVGAFLSNDDAPPPDPAEDPTERALQVARAAAAAEDAAAGGPDLAAELSPIGCARAIGLLAIEAEPESVAAWRAFAALAPSRAYWSAVAIADPGFDERLGIRSIRELAHVFTLDHRARQALPEGAPTPLDGTRFHRLALEFLNTRGAPGLAADPEILLDRSGRLPAAWIERAAKLWSEAEYKKKLRLDEHLEAIEAAAGYTRDARVWSLAAERLRAGVFPDRRPSPQAQQDEHETSYFGLAFGRRMALAFEAGAWRGVVFWRRALTRWLQESYDEDPNSAGQIVRAVSQAFDKGKGPIEAAVLRLIAGELGRSSDGAAAAPTAEEDAPKELRPPQEEEPRERRRPSKIGDMMRELRIGAGAAPSTVRSEDEPSEAPSSDPAPDDTPAEAESAVEEEEEARNVEQVGVGATEPLEIEPERAAEAEASGPQEETSAEPPLGAAEALDVARAAAARWRARYEKTLRARQKGEIALSLAFSAPGEEAADLDALEALAAITAGEARQPPEDVDAAIGADLGWTARQLLGMRHDWKERAPHEPAPEIVRTAWRTIAYADADADLQTDDMFFLFFASKLLQRTDRDGYDPDPISEPFFKLLQSPTNPVSFGRRERVTVTPYDVWLRDYVYLSRRRETEADLDKLDDDAVRARLDRVMFFLALITCEQENPEKAPAARLWDPIFRSAQEEARSVDAPGLFRNRLTLYFRSDDPTRLAYAHAFEKITTRHVQYQLADIAPLNRMTVRLRKEARGGTP